MANPEEAGPTPDSPERAAGSREPPPGGDQDTGWFGNLIKKTQKDAEETIKFIEEEHKKNVQKFEQAVDEIKHTAEEVVDSVQSQIEGRKSLKLLREERVRPVVVESSPSSPSSREISTRARARSRVALVLPSLRARSRTPRYQRSSPLPRVPRLPPRLAHPPPAPSPGCLFSTIFLQTEAEKAAAKAQEKLVEASTETQAAERALRDAGGPSRASSSVSKRAKVARSALLLARSEYAAARETVLAAERAVEKAEVALANSAAERNIMNLLFKRKLTPEEEEEQRVLLEESRRLKAVVTMQRNFRKAREIRRAATRVAERRRKMRLAVEHALKSVASAFLVYFALILLGRCLVALVGARHAFGAAVADASSRAFARARSLAPREHGNVRYGLASKLEAGENHVLRERNRALGERVSALELELRAATDALEVTHSLSPCAACSRDRELRAEAEERARTAEARSAALGTEVHALRALSTRFGASERDVQKASRSSSAVSRAWLDDPGVSFSAQVAAAATAAATVTLEARVSESTAARHAAEAEAEATRVEIEVLRNLIDEGFLPGGAGGKCWAEVADAKARAQVAAARVAGERAQSAAAFAVREKLDAYQSARSEAERRADEYRVELEALRALPPELRGVADDAEAGNAEEAKVQSPYAPRTRKTVVGAAKLVAAAKVASERVAQAAEALRGAETRAEVRRVELETLRYLVAGNGTAGVVDRAETVVFELPGAASRAHEAAERRVASRLRAEEEARARAETRAEVFRVELAAQRALEAERAAAAANASEVFFGAGKAQPGCSRLGGGRDATGVRRLEANGAR